MNTCICGTSLTQAKTGRPRKFCSDECRRAAEHTKRHEIKCARPNCKRMVIRGKIGRPQIYCSERCKKMVYYSRSEQEQGALTLVSL